MVTILIFACLTLSFWSFLINKKVKQKIGNIFRLESELRQAKALIESYSPVDDVKKHVALVEIEIEESLAAAKSEAKKIVGKADTVLKGANITASEIIKTAEVEAQKIAGSAYEALKKSTLIENTAIAMKNIVDGYGNQYVIPTNSLLDHLAESFSHFDAGKELRSARDKTRSMIKNQTAALCDYVEAYRKQTAIDFLTDAFNGKVDTILASVKEDNFGTLEQKIKFSYQTVNYNGRAFRDARIAEVYLASRLNELRWACTVQAIKEKEREEQRALREKIRDEEKAMREIEKAVKDGQKEEESLARSVEKVRLELANASEIQKAEYELKLMEVTSRLAEAEAKNKRVLSMAQQTKIGNVYIISNIGSFGEEVFKIGMTRRLDPMDRVDELGDASVPFRFDVHAMISSEDAPALEKELHRQFSAKQMNKVNARKEFFKISLSELKGAIEKLEVQAQWTMAAEAKEFRESTALINQERAA